MMGDQISIEITDGTTKAKLWAHYRWWTDEADPWKHTTVGPLALSGGSWYYDDGHAYFFAEILNLYTGEKSTKLVLDLRGLPPHALGDPFETGQSGTGDNLSRGGIIPYGWIRWRVLSII